MYKIPRVVIGENQTFLGQEDLLNQYGVETSVLQDEECIHMMKTFITDKPSVWHEDIGEP